MDREKLYQTALHFLNTYVNADNSGVPNDVACAEVVNTIYKEAFGEEIGGHASTTMLYYALRIHPKFQVVTDPLQGDIIISPTGYGNGKLKDGHVGIMGELHAIMSNDSYSGMFKQNYTLGTWKERYETIGGFPVKFFRRIDVPHYQSQPAPQTSLQSFTLNHKPSILDRFSSWLSRY